MANHQAAVASPPRARVLSTEDLSELSEFMTVLTEAARTTWLTVHSMDVTMFSEDGKERVGVIRLETAPNNMVTALFAPSVVNI